MPHPLAYSVLLLAASPILGQDRHGPEGRAVERIRVQQRMIVRIPRLSVGREQIEEPAVRWSEKKGPKCLPMAELEGASLSGRNTVDLITSSGERVRAVLGDDCSPMDFYSGFYLKGTPDGMVCADRDAIRMRSGGSCRIGRFRKLIAKR